MYSKEELQEGLKTSVFGRKLFVFDEIDSTNACAKALAEAGTEEGATVIADYQAEGRGRMGRTWQSPSGTNLLFSSILRPGLLKEKSNLLTFFACVAVARAVESTAQEPLECKWPNDLYLNGKKLSGILLENSFNQSDLEYSVVGVGINVNQTAFDDQIAPLATSLSRELKHDVDRKKLFCSVLTQLEELYPSVKNSDFSAILKEWNCRCSMFGRQITVRGGKHEISGTALRLADDGGLMLETTDGVKTVYAGDASVVR